MGRFNFNVDEAALLKAYRVSNLQPQVWEDVDHDTIDSVAGAIASAGTTSTDSGSDPLGLGAVIDTRDMPMEQKAAVLISSKSFDPKAFLSAVHPNATYQDLGAGVNYLKRSLDSRSEAIRILVEDNFDRFVAVKSSTDALFTEMQDELLADSTDFASAALKGQLKLATAKADQVFLPVLENASKADKLRSTLAVFERSKFFFNLPGSLQESIDGRRYEAAMRDYKKGKFLLESKPGQLLPAATSGPTGSQSTSSSASESQKRIFDKVWLAAEKVMKEMRQTLLTQLKESDRSVEEQEKTIEILLELEPSEEPIWTFLDSHHKHILDSLKDTQERLSKVVDESRHLHSSGPIDQTNIIAGLEDCISSVDNKSADQVIVKASGWQVWQAIWDLQKGLTEVMTTLMPGFWKVAKAHMDGKFEKSAPPASRRSPSQCKVMALEIVQLYISLVSDFFTISDPAAKSSRIKGADPLKGTSAGFVPIGTNSLTASHYLAKILGEIAECTNDLVSAEISSEATFGLDTLLVSARWRFEEVLCDLWLRDAHLLRHLETWEFNNEVLNTTVYLSRVHKFQKHNTTGGYKIATVSGASEGRSIKKPIQTEFTQRITKAFLDALYSVLDAFIPLATDDLLPNRMSKIPVLPGNAGTARSLDLHDMDIRMLLAISNLAHLKKTLVPNMMGQLEAAFSTTLAAERNTASKVITELDKELFTTFLKPKSDVVTNILRAGILDPLMDWLETPRPTEVRQYIFSMLLAMVEYHAKVGAVSKALLDRTMAALVTDITNEALKSFKQVRKFGMGGMLRATLEIEFMHQTLQQYVSPSAAQTFTEIYTTISDSYERRGDAAQQNLQAQLDGVKKTLSEARRATAISFVCFRKERSRTADGTKDKDRPGTPNERETRRERSRRDPETSSTTSGSIRRREGTPL